MPVRSQARIRRDINRLKETIDRHAAAYPALAAIKPQVDASATRVNTTWQAYQQAATVADKERTERDTAMNKVRLWIQSWRPVVLLAVPGAAANLRALPPGAATPDDVARVAEDLRQFITQNPGAQQFKDAALTEIGNGIESAKKESLEATAALPAEVGARAAYTEAALAANEIVVRGSEVVRALFGAKSPEYKQFIARASATEEEQEVVDSGTGEGGSGG